MKIPEIEVFLWVQNWFLVYGFYCFDALAEESNGIKWLLNQQKLFDWTVDGKWMKTKDSNETLRALLTMDLAGIIVP